MDDKSVPRDEEQLAAGPPPRRHLSDAEGGRRGFSSNDISGTAQAQAAAICAGHLGEAGEVGRVGQ